MIHPQAAADQFSAPLHRSFLISCFASGTVALFVLPLHLALAGAPHGATILVLAWMLGQWPLALYLSQSGALDRAIGISSVMFASFVAAVCFLTGGGDSFALFWFMIPPIEAAFASNRRVTIGVTALCAILLAAVALFQPPLSQLGPLPPAIKFTASLAAIFYVGMIAFRISKDRKLAQIAVSAAESKRRLISQNISEVLCELGPDGQVFVVGGPVAQMLGTTPPAGGEDWLFPRLHVADRPLYLTKLSEARHNAKAAEFNVRLRLGASVPGEAGQAEYRTLTLCLRPIRDDADTTVQDRLLLIIRDGEAVAVQERTGTPVAAEPRIARTSWALVEKAGEDARKSLSDIRAHVDEIETRTFLTVAGDGKTADQIASTCDEGLEALASILELAADRDEVPSQNFRSIEIGDCLEQCSKLLTPIADRAGVALEIDLDRDWKQATAERRSLRQSLCFILSDMIETSGSGAVIHISAEAEQSELRLVLSVKNRHSSLSWSSAESQPVLDYANGLLEQAGARLSVHTALGSGESVIISLPARFVGVSQAEATDVADKVLPLKKTA